MEMDKAEHPAEGKCVSRQGFFRHSHWFWATCAALLWLALMIGSWSFSPYWPDAGGYTSHIAEGRWVAHPPGYPLFVLLGHLVHTIGTSPYTSVQLASLLLTMASVPAMALLLWRSSPCGTLPYLLAAYLISWVSLLISKTGTSHAADLFTIPLLLAAAVNPRLATPSLRTFFLLSLSIVLVAGFRFNSALMQMPMLGLLLLWHRRDWRIYAALISSAAAIYVLQIQVIASSGGWGQFSAYANAMNSENRVSSMLLSGVNKTTLFNSFRSLLWFALSVGPMLYFTRYFSPRLLSDKIFVIGLFSMGSALGVTTLYLSTHPGYIAPALPGFFLCVARVWMQVQNKTNLKLVPVLAVIWGASLFGGLFPIEKPDTRLEAVANGILLQYGASAASASLFHTTSGWLILAGFAKDLDPEKAQRLMDYMQDDL